MTTAPDLRRRELGLIHQAKAALGLDDETYRALLERLTGKRSAADLDRHERARVIEHLKGAGGGNSQARPRRADEWAWANQAAPERQPLLWKLRRLCIEAGIAKGSQVRYCEGIARKMSGTAASAGPVEKPLRLCDEHELWRIAAALGKHLARNA